LQDIRQPCQAKAENETDGQGRGNQCRRDAQDPRDHVITPIPPIETHRDEKARDREEAIDRMFAQSEAGRTLQRLVIRYTRRDAEGVRHDHCEREAQANEIEIVSTARHGAGDGRDPQVRRRRNHPHTWQDSAGHRRRCRLPNAERLASRLVGSSMCSFRLSKCHPSPMVSGPGKC
jgi:hypothetical protein